MNNALKKVLGNKNTVTVVGIVAVIFILYFAYNFRINQAITPVEVPYAKELIKPGTQITEDKIGTMQISSTMASNGNIVTNVSDVIDRYANADSIIPEGSLFYKRQVVKKEQLPANIILNVKTGYVLYNLAVNTESTYGNAMYPGNYIDIYLKIVKKSDDTKRVSDTDPIMLGKFISNVKIIAVNDSSGNPVFSNLDEKAEPAMIIFAVPEDIFVMLKKAEYLGNYEADLIPVPTNESLKDDPGSIKLSNEKMKDYINDITEWTETSNS
ncbi:MAG: hypothetical protein IJI43_04440 [Bacilli bacterium]|nr:hypothetical protein [Bacilli bacterium]